MNFLGNVKICLISIRNSSVLLRGIFNIPRGIKSLYSLNIDADGVCLNKLEYGGEEFFDDKPYYTTYPFAEFFSERKRVEPYIFSVNLEWATIFGSRGAITTRNNDLITELSQEFGEARLDVNKHPIFSRLKKFRKRKLNGTYLFVCAPGSDTYAHWVFDILPRLILAKENGYFASVDKIIVSHSNNTFQRETLNWLCLPKEKIINIYNNNEICWQLQKVVTITIPSEFNSVSSWVPVKLKSFYSTHAKSTRVSQPEFVFIDRRDHRKVINPNFYDKLREYGFCVVFSEDIAESNKIHFFERTKILVNVYGSGGQNIIYCPVNCINLTIISNQHLMNLKFIDVYGWTLNNGGGYRTAVLVGEGLGRIDQNWCPININLKEFENFLIQNI